MSEENVVKRRGRKKKVKEEEPDVSTVDRIPNKRGRKAKVVEFKKVIDFKLNSFDLQETLVLHLPITMDKLLEKITNTRKELGIEKILQSTPIVPIAYGSENTNQNKNLKKASKKKQEKRKEESSIKIYNNINKNDQPEIIKIYDEPLLPTEIDYKNVKRITASKTNIACWWCCYKFDTYPVCAPLKYNEKTDIFVVVGCFCSFNCAKSYSMTEYNLRYTYNSFLYKRIMGQFSNIKKAPPKTVLKMFGGPITIEEYRETFDTLSEIKINQYPMVFMPSQIEYHKVIKKNDITNGTDHKKPSTNRATELLSVKNIDNINKRLSVTKNKSSSSSSNNTLMDIMGIRVKN